MARTYPLSLNYGQCLGHEEDPYSFSSLFLEDLHSGRKEYLANIQQVVDALPKLLDPTSCFALRAQVTPAGHQRLRHSIRAALWWLLPSDGEFRRASNDIQYYLACQGRRVVLRGGNTTQPFHESRLCWIPDPTPSPPRHAWNRNSQCLPVIPVPPFPVTLCALIIVICPCVKIVINQASAIATSGSPGAPLTPSLPKKCQRRRRRQARRAANQNRAPSSAAPVTLDERWANERTGRSGATQPLLEDSDPTSRMRTAVYPHPSIHSQIVAQPPISAANENSPFHLGLELGEFPGLYKPADPDPRQDSTARPFRVKNSGSGISSPPYLQPYTKPFSGQAC